MTILEEGLLAFIESCKDLSYEFILVNDGSSDDTAERLEALRKRLLDLNASALKKISIVDLPENNGNEPFADTGMAQ
jgi:glycosyltransferase involved in cell wall biosynthesis